MGIAMLAHAGEAGASQQEVCNAKNAGQVRQAPGGQQVCEHRVYGYQWRGLTISYQQLVEESKGKRREVSRRTETRGQVG